MRPRRRAVEHLFEVGRELVVFVFAHHRTARDDRRVVRGHVLHTRVPLEGDRGEGRG